MIKLHLFGSSLVMLHTSVFLSVMIFYFFIALVLENNSELYGRQLYQQCHVHFDEQVSRPMMMVDLQNGKKAMHVFLSPSTPKLFCFLKPVPAFKLYC